MGKLTLRGRLSRSQANAAFRQASAWPVHPIFFAILPPISLLAHNISQIRPEAGLRPMLFCLSVGGAALGTVLLLVRNLRRAALISSVFLVLFFSFGHVYFGLLHGSTLSLFSRFGLVGRLQGLMTVWAGLLVLAILVVLRRNLPLGVATRLFNGMGAVALCFPLWAIAVHEFRLREPWPMPTLPQGAVPLALDQMPDIYYIILDGYARQDVMQAVYGYDNRQFLDFLAENGFQVVDDARANYTQTFLSLASSLNADYLDPLIDQVGVEGKARIPLSYLIHVSRVREFLEAQGYRTVAFEGEPRHGPAEALARSLLPGQPGSTYLERLLYESSALVLIPEISRHLLDIDGLGVARLHRERILYLLRTLPDVAAEPGPKFVVAHILAPHPPFIFQADGSPRELAGPFSFDDGDSYRAGAEEYIEGYRDQAEFITREAQRMLSGVLANASRESVIIVQADHGPGAHYAWDAPASPGADERLAILNAVRFPEQANSPVYPGETPVNTFRMVLNAYFGTALPLRPDRSYVSTWGRPYHMIEWPPAQ